ncbi:MAG: oxygen-independent coproporphyrinogen III oxidase [Rikenellaceae bacterium]
MKTEIIEKYNVPVPRYTSYPPANFFSGEFTAEDYVCAIEDSNDESSKNISFYIHIPFCRHLCYYCGCNSQPILAKEVVAKYVSAVKQELDMVITRLDKTRKVSQIHYGGGTPTILPTETLKEINDKILSSFETIEHPEIAIECHPGYLDLEYWKGLITAGFTRVSIGVQDFNEDVLKCVHRRPSLEDMKDVFDVLKGAGISINMDFIYGLPLQSSEKFAESIKKAIALSPNRIVTFSYAHVPWVNKNMLKLEAAGLPDTETKKELFDTAKALLLEGGYLPVGMDHFVKPEDELIVAYGNGELHRNFQGYCTRRTTGEVYGIGVSSISQLSGCYSQNSKELKEYIDKIFEGEFTTVKGYGLTTKDKVTKQLIDMLMCNNKVEWDVLSSILNIEVDEVKIVVGYDDSVLRELENDGIVAVSDTGFEMTHEGKIFVRNVASVFDTLCKGVNSYSKPI